MKTIKTFVVSALVAISSSAFAGNFENCCSTELQSLNLMAASELSESGGAADNGVTQILQGMTREAREKVNAESIESILEMMTIQVRERMANSSAKNAF